MVIVDSWSLWTLPLLTIINHCQSMVPNVWVWYQLYPQIISWLHDIFNGWFWSWPRILGNGMFLWISSSLNLLTPINLLIVTTGLLASAWNWLLSVIINQKYRPTLYIAIVVHDHEPSWTILYPQPFSDNSSWSTTRPDHFCNIWGGSRTRYHNWPPKPSFL